MQFERPAGQKDGIQILAKIKDLIVKGGSKNVRVLSKNFRLQMSFDGSDLVNRQDFYNVLSQMNVQVHYAEQVTLINFLDQQNKGTISIEHFLSYIRGNPNPTRQVVIDQIFNHLDKDNKKCLHFDVLKERFQCSLHPKIQTREKTPQQVFNEFSCDFSGTIVTKSVLFFLENFIKEWDQYYAAVSASVDDDQNFIYLMKSTWGLE